MLRREEIQNAQRDNQSRVEDLTRRLRQLQELEAAAAALATRRDHLRQFVRLPTQKDRLL